MQCGDGCRAPSSALPEVPPCDYFPPHADDRLGDRKLTSSYDMIVDKAQPKEAAGAKGK
jgi:hypothetical protein